MRNEGKLISNLVRFYRLYFVFEIEKKITFDNIFIYPSLRIDSRGIVAREDKRSLDPINIIPFLRDYYYLLIIKFY